MPIWDDVISESDKEIRRKGGRGGPGTSFGASPALAVIDVTYDFVGNEPEPILKSMERFPLSCGENGWRAVRQIEALLPLCREKQIPIIYSAGETSLPRKWVTSNPRTREVEQNKIGNTIVKEIAPEAGDIVIHKFGPSIFFQTPLINVLIPLKIDTLLVCGGLTSCCVRASVFDAMAYGYTVGVIEECTFDREEISHKVNLFDMNKFARVVSINEAKDYLTTSVVSQ